MTSKRPSIPKQVHDKVLKEYRHRCAICGNDGLHLHHIDSDSANNDPLNLIPLCPNCYLSDQHDPTAAAESAKLGLFRRFKDSTILKPQFHPLFARLKFLGDVEADADAGQLETQANELIEFVRSLTMGEFYSEKIGDLIREPSYASVVALGDPALEARDRESRIKQDEEYRELLRANRDAVAALVVELLRFQKW